MRSAEKTEITLKLATFQHTLLPGFVNGHRRSAAGRGGGAPCMIESHPKKDEYGIEPHPFLHPERSDSG